MRVCDRDTTHLTGLLLGDLPPEREAELLDHARACAACAAELASLRAVWEELSAAGSLDVAPPPALRTAVLGHARAAVRPNPVATEPSGTTDPEGIGAQIWSRARRLVGPVSTGSAGAVLVVAALGLRGILTDGGPVLVAGLSVALAALLALLAGVIEGAPARTTRSVLVAGGAAFAGYAALTLAVPIPETVEFCRVRVLAGPQLSMGSLCLVYLAIAALYAGVPAGVAAYRWADRGWRGATVLAETAIFVLLAAPLLGLHLGLADAILGLSALAGLAIGSLGGGTVGGWLKGRTLARA